MEALEYIQQIDIDFPNDVEVQLNLAEAYLWNDQAQSAILVYDKILSKDQENFTANLGKANALANLKQYDAALICINKALSIDPENKMAQTSKRFVQYGVADKRKTETKYQEAIKVLDDILSRKENDEQALINKGICYLSMKDNNAAEKIFQNMYDNNLSKFEASILLSHINTIKHKNKNSQYYASQAIRLAEGDSVKQYRSQLQLINVLGASKEFEKAHAQIDEMESSYGQKSEIELARARLHVWNNDLSKAEEIYNSTDSTSYLFHMGQVEFFRSKGLNSKAKNSVHKALEVIPNQPDALSVLKEINLGQSIHLEMFANHSYDAGMNEADEIGLELDLPVGDKHEIQFNGKRRSTLQNFLMDDANQIVVEVGDRFKPTKNLEVFALYGIIQAKSDNETDVNNSLLDFGINYQLAKFYNLGIRYHKDALNYSSDLMQSGITQSQMIGSFLYSKHKWPSLFLQFENNSLSDSNNSHVLFASLFYQIKAFPLIKTGINYNSISYDFSKPVLYFSPEEYSTNEVFIHFGNDYDVKSKLVYHFEYTYGRQKIEADPWVNINRFSADLGYRFSDRFKLTSQYLYSSAANTTNKGFSFNRFQLKLNCII